MSSSEKYIEKYIPQKSFIFNLHGEGGIGKTVVTQEMYKNYLQYITECHMGIKAIYINASGCFSIPALLLRLRMSLGNDMYDFEKFDVMYELIFDASEYVKLKRMMEITTPQDQNLANFILDFTIKEINRDGQISYIAGTDIVKEVKDFVQDYKYEFDIVTDDDVKVPDYSTYKVEYKTEE